MTDVSFEYDRATAVVVPGAALLGDPEAWGADAADELAGHHRFADDTRRTLAKALIRAQQGAVNDLSTNVLLYEPASGTWAPLRFTLLERELTAEEQQEYLSPPAFLKPQIRLFETDGLGLGCSSTVVVDDSSGGVRWLFMPRGITFFAAMTPVANSAIVACAIAAEDILATVRVAGAGPESSGDFDPRAFIRAAESDDRAWRI
jgi:hypothetical protein